MFSHEGIGIEIPEPPRKGNGRKGGLAIGRGRYQCSLITRVGKIEFKVPQNARGGSRPSCSNAISARRRRRPWRWLTEVGSAPSPAPSPLPGAGRDDPSA